MSTIPKHRQLPDKENKLFKEILMNYELKQYKKGLKAADTVLKKFPNHGETLALKALTLYSSLPYPATATSLPKQEEAEQLARTAVKKDITSHMTWHVLGIMAKNKKEYGEASRAFAMARKQDNDNIPILRDSISLSLHTRSYPAAVAARHHLLTIRPQMRGSWIGLIIAHYLNADPTEAIEVYDQLQKASQVEGTGMSKTERAQLGLFMIKACREAGRAEDGLRRLEEGVRGGWLSLRGELGETKAQILLELGRHQEAEDAYRQLIEQNSDNLAYYAGFLRTKGLDIEAPTEISLPKILHHLDAFHSLYPRSIAPRRLTLTVATGTSDEFRSRVKSYIIEKLEKGIPSLFVDVKSLYKDAEKMRVVGEVVEGLIADLEGDVSLRGDDSAAPPTALLWAYYFLALHLSHPLHPSATTNYPRALSLLDVSLQHTPTLPEIYMAKARILKRSGDAYLAAVTMEQARDLDGQDRYINGKAAKYWVRAGYIEKGEELQGIFTKKDMTPIADLTDLQCLWFVTEEADAYRAKGSWAMGLKRYMSIVNIFKDYDDDQYDFHTYCLRRNTLSAYADLMKYEDTIRAHPGYVHAALNAVDIFTRAFDDPTLGDEKLTPEEEAERKRAAKKAQKAEQKAKKAAAATSDGKKEEAPIPDADPHGLILIKTETPLADALKVWAPLESLCANDVRTWTAGYDIRIRQGLYLAALKCLLKANEVAEGYEGVHWRILHFKRVVAKATITPAVQSTIDALLPSLLPGTAQELNDAYLAKGPSDPRRILGAARGVAQVALASSSESTLRAEQRAPILAHLASLAKSEVGSTVQDLSDALDIAQLAEVGATDAEVAELRAKYAEKVPGAWDLRSKTDKEKRASEVDGEKVAGEENGKQGKADV